MDRAEIICRGLTGVFIWWGMVGLALYILWTMHTGVTDLDLLVPTTQSALQTRGGHAVAKKEILGHLFERSLKARRSGCHGTTAP
jgi:hypothetical protein